VTNDDVGKVLLRIERRLDYLETRVNSIVSESGKHETKWLFTTLFAFLSGGTLVLIIEMLIPA
jgi:hypothetical protein